MNIETVSLDDIRPLDKNPRRHPERQIAELVRSFEMFGQYRPLVVDEEGVILAGNGMYQALQSSGASEVKIYRVTGLSDEDKKKLALADNRTGDMSNDDFDVIEELLAELTDFEIPGYDEETLRKLMADADSILEDADNYGVLDPDTVTAMQSQEEAMDSHEEGVQVGTPPPPISDPAPPTAQTSEEGLDVCPTCGRGW